MGYGRGRGGEAGTSPEAGIRGDEQGEGSVMHDGYKTTGMRRQWMVLLGLLVALLVVDRKSVV